MPLLDLKLRVDADSTVKLVYLEYNLIASYVLYNIKFINLDCLE